MWISRSENIYFSIVARLMLIILVVVLHLRTSTPQALKRAQRARWREYAQVSMIKYRFSSICSRIFLCPPPFHQNIWSNISIIREAVWGFGETVWGVCKTIISVQNTNESQPAKKVLETSTLSYAWMHICISLARARALSHWLLECLVTITDSYGGMSVET